MVDACWEAIGYAAVASRTGLETHLLLDPGAGQVHRVIGEAASTVTPRHAGPDDRRSLAPTSSPCGNRLVHACFDIDAGHRVEPSTSIVPRLLASLERPGRRQTRGCQSRNRLMAKRTKGPRGRRRSRPSSTRTRARTSRPRSCATSSPTRKRRRRRCSTRATRRSTRSSSGRARTSRTPAARSAGRPDLHPGEDRTRRRSSRTCAQTAKAGETEPELRLLRRLQRPDDFDKKVDFYHHDQHWTNRMILGDSLLVMTSLAEKEGLKGQVQMIYFDPPYGIKFGSNWQVSHAQARREGRQGRGPTRQPEQIRAFRDTWELGIHSYLALPARPPRRRPRAADRERAASSSRSATRTCISSGACWTRCSGARTSFARSRSRRRRATAATSCRRSATTSSGTRRTASVSKYRQLYREQGRRRRRRRPVRLRRARRRNATAD